MRSLRLFNFHTRQEKLSGSTVWTATAQNCMEQVVHTHRTSCRSVMAERAWAPKLGQEPIKFDRLLTRPNAHSWILFTSVSVGNPVLFPILLYSLPLWSEYLFTMHQGVVRNPVCHVTLQFRDRSGACTVFFRDRNRAEITVLMCEQKPYQVWFSCRRKSSPVK